MLTVYTPKKNQSTPGSRKIAFLDRYLLTFFFNTFEKCLINTESIQYADDTVIFAADKDVNHLSSVLNEDLSAISNFFYENELLANLKKGKTEAMLFGTSKRLSKINHGLELYYREEQITNTDNYKYLGNIVDSTLTLNEDFDRKYKSTTKRLNLMSKVRPFLTKICCCKNFQYDDITSFNILQSAPLLQDTNTK
jgi:hypothetical protein